MVYWKYTYTYDIVIDVFENDLPKNFSEIPFGIERNTDDGITATFSDTLEMVNSMKTYIDAVFNDGGVDAVLTLKVEYKDYDFAEWNTLFIGQADFYGIRIEKYATFLEFVGSRFLRVFDARRDIDINLLSSLDLDGNAITPPELERIMLKPKDWISAYNNNENGVSTIVTNVQAAVPTKIVAAVPTNDRMRDVGNTEVQSTFPLVMSIFQGWFYRTARAYETIEVDISFDWELVVTTPADGRTIWTLEQVDRDGNLIERWVDGSSGGQFVVSENNTGTCSINETITLQRGDNLRMYGRRVEGSFTGYYTMETDITNFEIHAIGVDGYLTHGISVYNAFNAIIEKMFGNGSYIDSDIFKFEVGDWDGMYLTTGGQTNRQNETEFILSFNKLFESVKYLFDCGFDIDNDNEKIKIAIRSEFFDNTLSLDFDSVTEKSISISDEYYSEIKAGFKEQSYSKKEIPEGETEEVVIGSEEFNNLTNFASPRIIDSEIDMTSDIKGDGATIFYSARQQDEDSPEQSNNKTVYFIHAKRQGVSGLTIWRPVTADDFDTCTGLSDPQDERINILLSPQYSLRRSTRLTPMLKSGEAIQFIGSNGFTEFTTKYESTSETIIHNENVQRLDMESALYSGKVATFIAPLTPDNLRTIQANPYKKYRFTTDNINFFSGYIVNISAEIVEGMGKEWKILLI